MSPTDARAADAGRPVPPLPRAVWWAMLRRSFVVQGAWSYDVMIGPGVAYAIEPALRLLPGGPGGTAYREALARHAQYFNCHPYFASMAVGALARLELDQAPPAVITRFRSALCGPLGSVGDRLVWAAWLPTCALFGLLCWGAGAGPAGAVLAFVLSYNVGHVAIRAWGLTQGWRRGQQVATALGAPWLRDGPARVGRVAAVLAGLALPLVAGRLLPGDWLLAGAV
nr:PTS system mannose/fructose/sorbose family transporter subunit IID [Gemmatimonadaceae bacterium]